MKDLEMSDRKEKFTPGPWRPGFKNIGYVQAENGALIAKCQRLTSLCNLQANAQLTAAAPELYEALDMAVKDLITAANMLPDIDLALLETARRAHSVLAKARGER
ncbi:hypothetical protein JK183_04740 [Acetobacter thailandicus]|nr:hypothetical protein [Acetobacter thailandicus]